MKLWHDNRFWGFLFFVCLFLFGLVMIVIGFDVYGGVIIVGFVLFLVFELFKKYIKRWRGSEELS